MNTGFEYESKFNTDNAFTGIKFGYDRSILETELNEMQEIQDYNRRSLIHKICKSGIIELTDRNFVGDKIVYSPNMERNKIAIAPMRVNVNGYEIHVRGDYTLNEVKSYLDIDLGEAPSGDDKNSQYREDLVFLQVWFDEITANNQMKRYGNDMGTIIPNTLIDSRVGEETSHRIGLKWKIRTVKGIDFNTWENGFGYNHSGVDGYSNIETDIANRINIEPNSKDGIFANATHYIFKGCSFYGDNNLWVAGRPNLDDPSNTKDSNLVFAIPLFKLTRRNKQLYSLGNPNGAINYEYKESNLRPDGKCYDIIYESDIIDLRKNVIVNNNEFEYYLDNTLNDLFSGKLTTKTSKKMRRIQFGIKPILSDIDIQKNITIPNLIFLDSFDPSQTPITNNVCKVTQRENTTLSYVPSVTEWGANIDGNVQFSYNINKVNPDKGTIDFFIEPKWNGFDDVDQTILELCDFGSKPILSIKKVNNKLEINRYIYPKINSTYVRLNNMTAKKIYHVRICWNSFDDILDCYINGNLVGKWTETREGEHIEHANDMTIITTMFVGKEEPYTNGKLDNNMGFVIDELSVYDKCLGNTNWKIPQDYIKGDALILPSFNGIFRNYRDNQYEQKNMVNYFTSIINTTTLTIDAPYNTTFGITTPKIYCLSTKSTTPISVVSGTELIGTWEGLNTNNLTFRITPNAIAGFTKFSGERFAIVYSINISSGSAVDDVPIELLKSEITNYNTNISKEVSFNTENNTGGLNEPREVNMLINKTIHPNLSVTYSGRRYVSDMYDNAYDFSTYRNSNNDDFAFSRLLEFCVEGNSTNLYNINAQQYGYDVLYVRKAHVIHNLRTNDIRPINITKVEIKTNPTNSNEKIFAITVRETVYVGDTIKFELALGGTTFDYNNNSNTFVGNTCKSEYLNFTTTGNHFEYIIPLNNTAETKFVNNGLILALGTQYTYPIKNNKEYEISNPTKEYICFRNNKLYKYTYISGINKPYLKLRISQWDVNGNEEKIPAGEIIQIPVFMTYQPMNSDILSVWYNYVPYQGTLDDNNKKLRRLTDWKYFVTTLSSGNTNDKNNKQYSLNNLINYLPGGASNCSSITGQDICLKTHDLKSFQNIDGYQLNKKLIFINQGYIGTVNNDIDKYLFNLETNYIIKKQSGKIQDGNILINNKDFKVYLPMNDDPINKYCGMACIVSDDFGDLYLFVIGDTNNNTPSVNNSISPKFGDLFTIPGRPSLINRN